jgi:hypothetical protein
MTALLDHRDEGGGKKKKHGMKMLLPTTLGAVMGTFVPLLSLYSSHLYIVGCWRRLVRVHGDSLGEDFRI